jgi:hypothetical protein
MLPNTTIVIGKNGDSRIEGEERSDACGKLSQLGQAAGKVTSDDEKDHTPVYHDVNRKQR